MRKCFPTLLVLAALLMGSVRVAGASDAPNAAGLAVSLFDTATPSEAALTPEALAARGGWVAVPEGRLDHAFAGDLVVMNDRLAVVLRQKGQAAELYSRIGGAFYWRAELATQVGDGSVASLRSCAARENGSAAVAVEAIFAAGAAPATLTLRLTAGEILLEIRPGPGAQRLHIHDRSALLVVPDFFADDMVFDPEYADANRAALPVDNCLLSLVDDGRAIVASVWRGGGEASADFSLAGPGGHRTIGGYEIQLSEGKSLWIALLEGDAIWHRQPLTGANACGLHIEWNPPFPAKWRADLARADGTSLSRVIDEAGPATGPGESPPRLFVAYPIDRSRATPLTAYCLVDVMRSAVGCGPCQYVLDAEGLGGADSSTPELVTHWVEKQLEKKTSRRDGDAIRERIADMLSQSQRTDARIERYRDVMRQIEGLCATASLGTDTNPVATRIRAVIRPLGVGSTQSATSKSIAPIATSLSALVNGEDVRAVGAKLCGQIRLLAGQQDHALARLRMAVRRLTLECRGADPANASAMELAGRVRGQLATLQERK